MTIQEYLEIVIKKEASDLHLVVGSPPIIRVDGQLMPIAPALLTAEDTESLIMELVTYTVILVLLFKNKYFIDNLT